MNNHRAWGSTHDETDINITGASILTNAHHVTMNNPYFAAYHGHDTVPAVHDSHIGNNEGDSYGSSKRKGTEPMHGTQKRRKFSPSESCYDLDEEDLSGVPKISRNRVILRDVISARKGSRICCATTNSEVSEARVVLVQVFEGSNARQLWKNAVQCSQRWFNPHILNIIGVSPYSPSYDDSNYIVFDGPFRRDTRRLVASLLGKGCEQEIIAVSLRVVLGIASGLAYLSKASSNLSLGNIIVESLDVFSDDDGHSVLHFSPGDPQGIFERDASVCNSFISKLFNDATHIVYREKLYRNYDDIEDEDISPTSSYPELSNEHLTGGLNAKTMKNLNPIISCRREIIWTSSNLKEHDTPLSEISRTYGDLLECYVHSPANSSKGLVQSDSIQLSRRSGTRKSSTLALHNCEGYIREEITLTPDAFKNVIVVFGKPTLNEVCVVCGEVVKRSEDPQSTTLPRPSSAGGVETASPSGISRATNLASDTDAIVSGTIMTNRTPKSELFPNLLNHGWAQRAEDYIPRPPTAYILFRSSFLKSQVAGVETNRSALAQLAGLTWRSLPKEEQTVWYAKAEAALVDHKRKFPQYNYDAVPPLYSKAKFGLAMQMKERETIRHASTRPFRSTTYMMYPNRAYKY